MVFMPGHKCQFPMHVCHYLDSCFSIPHSVFFLFSFGFYVFIVLWSIPQVCWTLQLLSHLVCRVPLALENGKLEEEAATAVGVSVVSQPTRVWVCVRVLESGECTQSRKGKVFVWTARNQHESNVDDNENKSAFVGVFWGGYGFWNNWIIAALRKLRKKCLLTHGESNATWFCDTSCTQMEYDMHASPKCGNLELYTHINIYIYLYICCMW